MTDQQKFPVLPDDDGIHPAGRPDECFYCRQKVGEEHKDDCVMVSRYVIYEISLTSDKSVIGTMQTEDPAHWTIRNMRFHKNDSSWCTGIIIDSRAYHLDISDPIRWQQMLDDVKGEHEDVCLCWHITLEPVKFSREILRAEDAKLPISVEMFDEFDGMWEAWHA